MKRSVISCNLWEYQGVAPEGLGIYLSIEVFEVLSIWSIEEVKVLKY